MIDTEHTVLCNFSSENQARILNLHTYISVAFLSFSEYHLLLPFVFSLLKTDAYNVVLFALLVVFNTFEDMMTLSPDDRQ